MAKWEVYTGSAEQIRELKANTHGYIVRNIPPITGFILSPRIRYDFELSGISEVKFEYLICQPHPYADLIKIWADTGCPVWIRAVDLCYEDNKSIVWERYGLFVTVTDTPDWNIPGAEYSLTPFGD